MSDFKFRNAKKYFDLNFDFMLSIYMDNNGCMIRQYTEMSEYDSCFCLPAIPIFKALFYVFCKEYFKRHISGATHDRYCYQSMYNRDIKNQIEKEKWNKEYNKKRKIIKKILKTCKINYKNSLIETGDYHSAYYTQRDKKGEKKLVVRLANHENLSYTFYQDKPDKIRIVNIDSRAYDRIDFDSLHDFVKDETKRYYTSF